VKPDPTNAKDNICQTVGLDNKCKPPCRE